MKARFKAADSVVCLLNLLDLLGIASAASEADPIVEHDTVLHKDEEMNSEKLTQHMLRRVMWDQQWFDPFKISPEHRSVLQLFETLWKLNLTSPYDKFRRLDFYAERIKKR